MEYVIGIDLGGTKTEACLLDSEHNLLERQRVYSEPQKGLDRVVSNIENLVRNISGGQKIAAIGMGTPGTYFASEDVLHGSPHTPVYETPGFIGRIRETFGVPLAVENDANCLALAEYFETCSGTYDFVMAVILGTGMGYGLILDKKLYRGSKGGGGEIGHTTIDINGRLCTCGRLGCAEAYLSGPSQAQRFAEMSGKSLDMKQIFELYEAGDDQAVQLFEESSRMMGEVFANAVNTLDLEAIILGGGVSNIPVWYEKVPHYMKKSFFGPPRDVPILQAKLGDSAGVFGAAYLALRELGVMEF